MHQRAFNRSQKRPTMALGVLSAFRVVSSSIPAPFFGRTVFGHRTLQAPGRLMLRLRELVALATSLNLGCLELFDATGLTTLQCLRPVA
jgi:ABC-type Co2+ transport system permease subunit